MFELPKSLHCWHSLLYSPFVSLNLGQKRDDEKMVGKVRKPLKINCEGDLSTQSVFSYKSNKKPSMRSRCRKLNRVLYFVKM